MFVIPFVFAFYPELLLIEQAVIAPGVGGGAVEYLPGYDGESRIGPLVWLIVRLALALYLLASALARFDRARLPLWEVTARLAAALALVAADPSVWGGGLVAFAVLIGRQALTMRAQGVP